MTNKFQTVLVAVAAAFAIHALGVAPAAAGGGRVFQFGGPLPSFKATRHGSGSSHYRTSKGAYAQKKKKLRQRAAAKARARAHAKAMAKAEAKRKAIERAKAAERRKAIAQAQARQKAEKKKKAIAQAKAARKRDAEAEIKQSAKETAPDHDRAIASAPSTAVLLTKKELSGGAPAVSNKGVPAKEIEPETNSDSPKAANETNTVAVKEVEKPADAETNSVKSDADDTENRCKKFIPAVGLTISVDC